METRPWRGTLARADVRTWHDLREQNDGRSASISAASSTRTCTPSCEKVSRSSGAVSGPIICRTEASCSIFAFDGASLRAT